MSGELLQVLLVEDERSLREPLAKHLRDRYGYRVDTAADAVEAWRLVTSASQPYDVALIDDLLTPEPDAEPELIGVGLMEQIRERCPETECIVFTGWGMDRALTALQAGAYRYLAKPLNVDELGMTIRMAAEQARLRRERDLLSTTLEISNAMVSGLDIEKILRVIADAVPKLVEADACAVARVDPATNRVWYRPAVPFGDVSVRWHRHLRNVKLTRRIIETGEFFTMPDVEAEFDRVDENLCRAGVKSFIAVPIPGEPQNLGVLYAYSTRKKTFGMREQQVLQLLAGQAAVALANARLFEAEAQRRREAETLRETALAMTAALEQHRIFELILIELQKVVPYDSASVQLLKEDRLEIIGGRGFPNLPEIVGISFPIDGDNPNREVMQRRGPFIVADAQAEYPDFSLEPHVQADIHGWLGVPMLIGGQFIGMIALDKRQPGFYTEEHARLAQTFATQAALAIENARLFDEANRRARSLETLQNLALTVNSSLDLDETLKAACQAAVEFFNADHSGLVLFDPNYAQGYARAEYPGLGTLGKIIPLRGVSAEERLIETQTPLVIFDVVGDKSLGAVKDTLLEFDIQSILIVPVVGKSGELLGSFSLDAVGHRRQFTTEEVELCRVFAAHVAVAVENAQLFSELSEANEWREALVENAFDAVIAIDRNNKITVFNQRAEEMFGWKAGEMIGRTVKPLHVDVGRAREIFEAVNREGAITGWEVELKHRDGTRIPALLSATLIRDSRGRPIGQAGFIRDLRQVSLLEDRLRALIRVSQAITGTLELDQVLDLVVESTVAAFPTAQSATIHLYDETADTLRVWATTQGYSAEALEALRLRVEEGITGWVFQHQQPLVVDDTQQEPRYKRIDHPEVQVHRSMICVPLHVRKQIIGTLSLNNSGITGAFQSEDLGLLSYFADQAAIAIDNARLYQEADRRQQLLTALDEASRHIRAEKETPKLLHQVVRLATRLVGCTAGSLFINRPHLGELELAVTYELPTELSGSRLPHAEGLAGLVARTGKPQIVSNYSNWPDREAIFEPYDFRTAAGVPLKHAGEVEAVLLVADSTDPHRLIQSDLEILERFAVQAAIALQASRLMSREQRILGQLGIFHQISDYIQAAGDLDKILHVVLTGVTAGYGLGFNRAALLLLDERRECLVGRMGIGHLEEPEARRDWAQHHAHGLEDFRRYLELLEQDGLPLTPLGDRIREVRLPVKPASCDLFLQAVREQRCILVTQDDLDRLPESFVKSFEPELPLVVAPLMAHGQTIGLLVADNKFTQSPITPEAEESLLTFVNTAAVAIDNAQLYQEARLGQEKLRSFYEASNALISSQDLEQILQDIVEQARVAAQARGVSMILIDKTGQVRKLITAGADKPADTTDMVRKNGLSMEVMRTGQPAIIEDTNAERDRVNPSMFWRKIAAALCLPVALEGEHIGVVWFHYDEPRRFSMSEIEAVQLYVNQAALAYDSARRIKELEHMRQAAEALAGAASLQEVLEEIVQSAREVLQANSAAIWSYDDVRDRFIPESSVSSGIPPELWQEFRQEESRPGRTAYKVIEQGWIGVSDVGDTECYGFLGGSTRKLLDQIGVRSFQGIALVMGDEKLGVLYVNYNSPRSFHEREQEIARTFANHAALALKKARLLEQVSKARDAAKVVAQVTVLGDREATLSSVAQGTREAMGCDAVTLFVYDQTTNKLDHPPTMVGVRYPDRASLYGEVLTDSIVYEMLRRDEPYIVEIMAHDALFRDRRFAKDEEIESCVAIPLKAVGQKVGVMFVNYRTRHRFTEEELTNIELFAHQAAVAIRNAQLYEETTRRAAALQALYEAGKAVTSSLALNDILSRIVEQACKLTGRYGKPAHFSHLALVEGDRLRFVAAYPPKHLPGLQRRVGDIDLEHDERIGVTGHAVKTGQSQLVGDVTQDPDYIEYDLETRSELAVPIKLGEKVVGVINVEHPENDAFEDEDQQALEALAAQAALAIRNAQMYSELIQRYDDLQQIKGFVGSQTVLDWMRMVSTVWGHSIKREVGTSLVCAELVRSAIQKGKHQKALKELEDLETKVRRIRDIPITAPLSAEDAVTSVRVNRIIESYLRNLWGHSQYSSVHLELDLQPDLDDTVTVRASEEWLRRGIEIVVDNAVRAMLDTDSRQKQLSVTTRLTDGTVEILIRDTGPGIPNRIKGKLFKEPIDKPKGSRGVGVGLVLAGTIFEAYQGNIAVRDTGPSGTLMVISLPVESSEQ